MGNLQKLMNVDGGEVIKVGEGLLLPVRPPALPCLHLPCQDPGCFLASCSPRGLGVQQLLGVGGVCAGGFLAWWVAGGAGLPVRTGQAGELCPGKGPDAANGEQL